MILNLKINNKINSFFVNKENELSLNSFYDNLSNPTEYMSDFTHSIKIERTPQNNKIFAHYGELDMLIATNTYDPKMEMKYDLLSDYGETLMSGNAYMNKVDDDYFYIVLFGAKNEIFLKLLNSGWSEKKKEEDEKYYLLPDYLKYNTIDFTTTRTLNANRVRDGWYIDSENKIFNIDTLLSNFSNLKNYLNISDSRVKNDGLFIGNFVQFLPTNQGLYDSFKSDKWYIMKDGKKVLTNVLNTDTENTKDYGELVDYQMGEFRDYYLSPGFYIQRLFDIFRKECKKITGYEMIYDESWWNENNKYIDDLMIMLPPLFQENDRKNISSETTTYSDNKILPAYEGNYLPQGDHVNNLGAVGVIKTENVNVTTDRNTYTFEFDVKMKFDSGTTAPTGVYFNYNNGIALRADLSTPQGLFITSKSIYILPLLDTKNEQGEYEYNIDNTIGQRKYSELLTQYHNVYIIRHSMFYGGTEWNIGKAQITLKYTGKNDSNNILRYTVQFGNEHTPFFSIQRNTTINGDFDFNYIKTKRAYLNVDAAIQKNVDENTRSFCKLTLNNLFKNVSPFSLILRYCKMMNLVFLINEEEKKIIITERDDHFYKCMTPGQNNFPQEKVGILSFNNFINRKKTIEISPINVEHRRLIFNYEKGKGKYYEDYEKKYGKQYGQMTINTDNTRNDEDKKLFCNNENDKLISSIVSSEFFRSTSDMLNNINVLHQAYPQIANLNKENYFNFYFRNKNGAWDDEIYNGIVQISDDFQEEIDSDTYAYHNILNNSALTTIRPRMSTATWNDEININFAPSQESYIQFPFLPTMKYLYEQKWKNYIEEVYFYENKKVKFAARINSQVYNRLKMNPLISINNAIYIVTAVEDFKGGDEDTKITALQIRDIKKLTGGKLDTTFSTLNWNDGNSIIFDDNSKIMI